MWHVERELKRDEIKRHVQRQGIDNLVAFTEKTNQPIRTQTQQIETQSFNACLILIGKIDIF